MPPIHVLIKPASSNCNLRCRYCFYHDEASKREVRSFGLMSGETLEAIVQKALAYASGSCTFGFQGGEPMLAGLDFFQTLITLQKKHNVKNLTINNSIQTNGTMIDDEWAAFFYENHFLVGVSLDGDESLHNLYRRDAEDQGTFRAVMRGIDTLKRNKAEFNILTVVTAQTAKRIREVYSFFMRNGLVYQQYIPCLEPLGEACGKQKYLLTPKLYAMFLRSLFDVWYADRQKGIFVYNRYFENLLFLLSGHYAESCDMNGVCSMQYAIEADGSVFPCDFYMLDSYRIGNIVSDSLAEIDQNRHDSGFIQQSVRLPDKCASCGWVNLCRGGCKRHRVSTSIDDCGLNYYCEAYQEVFPYIVPRLITLLPGKTDR